MHGSEPHRETKRSHRPVPPDRVVPPVEAVGPAEIRPQHLYKTAGLLFLFALFYRFFDALTQVFLIAYAAVILAVALNTIVQPIPLQRRWGSALLGVVILGAIGAALWFGVPALVGQIRGFSQQVPQMQEEIHAWGEWLRRQTGLNIEVLSDRSRRYLQRLFGGMQGTDLLGQASSLLEIILLPLIVLFGGLFAVANPNERLLNPVLRAVPRDRRLAFRRMFELLGMRLRGWIKGTLLAMLGVGLLSIGALYLIGVPYALMLGLANGLLEFIPLAGPWVGGLVAVLVAFTDDPSKAVWVALAMLAIQQTEANIITPLAMSRAAEVHPFVTLFALVLFSYLFGFLGLLLAIPLTMLFWTMIEVLWVERAIDTDEDHIAPVVRD